LSDQANPSTRGVEALAVADPFQETSDNKEAHMQRVETTRLVLRPFAADDWGDFQELSLDWKAAPGPAFDKWRTSDEACQESVQYMSTRDNYFAMYLRESGKLVGLLGINGIDEEKQADLGHVILSHYQDDDHDREASSYGSALL
jgi:RimJ/RimL family protein N-acetyltransferase